MMFRARREDLAGAGDVGVRLAIGDLLDRWRASSVRMSNDAGLIFRREKITLAAVISDIGRRDDLLSPPRSKTDLIEVRARWTWSSFMVELGDIP